MSYKNHNDHPISEPNLNLHAEIKLHSYNIDECKIKDLKKKKLSIKDIEFHDKDKDFKNLDDKEKMIKLNQQNSYLKDYLTINQNKISDKKEKKNDKNYHKINQG